tara:strand:+ start:2950 stop:4152 length:1203 start_codon:yes stop_codon:yes gene_type:complete
MGFLASANTITITAKLTPFGRQQLLTNSSSIITQFSLGDSDANYTGELTLGRGEVPAMAGEIGTDFLFSNGVYSGVNIKSPIVVNGLGDIRKLVSAGSSSVLITPKNLGLTTITGSTLTQLITDRTNGDNDAYANLFKSFGLPITTNEKLNYSSISSPTGYLDTAIRNLNKDKVLVIAIDKCSYGETLDGKAIKVNLETSGGTPFTLYSTFEKSLTPLTSVDNQVKELLSLGTAVNNNIAFLFSDSIRKPNNNPSLSWGTGFGTTKPFSLNNKQLFNPVSVSSTNTNVDTAVGVAYLDKGFIVITEPSIVDNYNLVTASATTVVTHNHISNEVSQNITCIVERDEFSSTNNSTYTSGDLIRVSEVALYDTFNNVIAYAKSNEHIIIGASQYVALGVKILV